MSPLSRIQTVTDPATRELLRQVQRQVDSLESRVARLEANRGTLDAHTDASRPRANERKYRQIFNTDDGFPNVSDGTNWLDPTGAVT